MGWRRPVSESAIRGVALLSIGLALAVVGFLAVGCASKGAAVPATSGEAAAPDTAVGAPDHPCVRYALCCTGFVEALQDLPGYPDDSVNAARQGCQMVLEYIDQPGMDDACQQGLDVFKEGIQAMEAMPDFQVPGACR